MLYVFMCVGHARYGKPDVRVAHAMHVLYASYALYLFSYVGYSVYTV